MATQATNRARTTQAAFTPTTTTIEQGRGVVEPGRSRRAEGKQVRLISPRERRILARWLRRTANRTSHPGPLTRTPEPLLQYRAATVRSDLLEIAAMLEHARSPDPACVEALRSLLANGCDSPLYNAAIHISELHATLDYVRSGL